MAFSDLLIKQLATLTEALDEPGTDLEAIIAVLHDDVGAAVRSFLGLTIAVSLEGVPVQLEGIDQEGLRSAASSLRVPLHARGSPPVGHIVFYAREPAAFAGLTTDAYRVHQLDGQVLVDHDLDHAGGRIDHRTDHHDLSDDVSDQGDINQAVGVLIDRGHLPQSARASLEREARRDAKSLATTARKLLASLSAAEYNQD